MAEPGGPRGENEVAAANVRLTVVGAAETQKTLEAAAKQTEAVAAAATKQASGTVAGQTAANKATKETVGTFADLKSKLDGAQPSAMNLVATLSDVAGVAQQFVSIGVAIGEMIQNAPLLQRQLQDLKMQQGQAERTGQANMAASPMGNSDALIAAGINPDGMNKINERIAKLNADIERMKLVQTYTREMDTNVATQAMMGTASVLATIPGVRQLTGANDPANNNFTPSMAEAFYNDENLASAEKERAMLNRQRDGMKGRQLEALNTMRGIQSNAPFVQQALGAMNGATMGGGNGSEAIMQEMLRTLKNIEQNGRNAGK